MARQYHSRQRHPAYVRAKMVGVRHGRWLWAHKVALGAVIVVGLLMVIGPAVYAVISTRGDRYGVTVDVPSHAVAIVFGAGVEPDGTPTPYLQKRIQTAVALYHAGTVHTLLLSGDNSTSHHNEPVAMGRYAESLGVPADRIVLDYAGFNTYDTCYRARAIFNVHQAVLVSHAYHLPRAIMTCSHTGVKSIGVAAENAGRIGRDYSVNYLARELLSTDKAVLQIVFKPKPTVLGPLEPITK
jgi:vancomycin permeability regulator SanA